MSATIAGVTEEQIAEWRATLVDGGVAAEERSYVTYGELRGLLDYVEQLRGEAKEAKQLYYHAHMEGRPARSERRLLLNRVRMLTESLERVYRHSCEHCCRCAFGGGVAGKALETLP